MNAVNIKKVFKIATQFIEIQEKMRECENYYYHLTKQKTKIMNKMINFIETNENSDAS